VADQISQAIKNFRQAWQDLRSLSRTLGCLRLLVAFMFDHFLISLLQLCSMQLLMLSALDMISFSSMVLLFYFVFLAVCPPCRLAFLDGGDHGDFIRKSAHAKSRKVTRVVIFLCFFPGLSGLEICIP
jgi:hypothetical protein